MANTINFKYCIWKYVSVSMYGIKCLYRLISHCVSSFSVLLVPYYYPVYQYYKYEKTRNQNLIAEQQTMYQDSTELEIITV